MSRRFPIPKSYDDAKLRLAVLYYWTKAVRTARAAVRLAEKGDVPEALLMLRGLYNVVVDCLWMCAEPATRGVRFYDATAIGFERQREVLAGAGVEFGPDTAEAVAHNRAHFERAADQFKNKKGRVLVEWAPGSLRDRARDVVRTEPDLEGLDGVYDVLYGSLSEYEHSAPFLCFQFVQIEGDYFTAAPNPLPISPAEFGKALGLLLAALMQKTMHHLGLTPADFAA